MEVKAKSPSSPPYHFSADCETQLFQGQSQERRSSAGPSENKTLLHMFTLHRSHLSCLASAKGANNLTTWNIKIKQRNYLNLKMQQDQLSKAMVPCINLGRCLAMLLQLPLAKRWIHGVQAEHAKPALHTTSLSKYHVNFVDEVRVFSREFGTGNGIHYKSVRRDRSWLSKFLFLLLLFFFLRWKKDVELRLCAQWFVPMDGTYTVNAAEPRSTARRLVGQLSGSMDSARSHSDRVFVVVVT